MSCQRIADRITARLHRGAHSLATVTLLLFAAATLAPLLLALLQTQLDVADAQRQAQANAQGAARTAARDVDGLIDLAVSSAEAASQSDGFWEGSDDVRDRALAAIAHPQAHFNALLFYTPDLAQHGSSNPEARTARPSAASRAYAQEAIRTGRIAVTAEPLRTLSPPFVLTLPVAIPVQVTDSEGVTGLVVAGLKLDYLPAAWDDVSLPTDASIMLVDARTDIVLTANSAAQSRVGERLTAAEVQELDTSDATVRAGGDAISASAATADLPWRVLVEVPASVVLDPLYTAAKLRALLSGSIAATTLGLLWLLWRQIAGRLGRLQQAAARWGAGQWAHRAGVSGVDELGQLGVAFDRMAGELEGAVRQRDAALAQALAGEEQYRTLLEEASDGIFLTDVSGRYVDANAQACELVGYTRDELLSLSLVDVLVRQDAAMEQAPAEELRTVGKVIAERSMRRKDGTLLEVEASVRALHDGRVQAIVRDITERKRAQEVLALRATHDALTGLPNRLLLQERLASALSNTPPARGSVALLLLDLDRFKEVNDALGHHAGDALLIEVARRLNSAIRPTDTVARLGGDEFALILPDAGKPDSAVLITRRILDELESPVLLNGVRVQVGASIGIALSQDHGQDGSALLQQADMAMYVAKRAHSGYAVYSPGMEHRTPGGERSSSQAA